jgi:hypothetical protein
MGLASVNRWMIALLAGAALLRGTVLAADHSPREVKVSVVAILASEEAGKVDPRLEDVARAVRERHPQLKSFRLAKMTCKSVRVGKAEKFDLVADQKAVVTVLKPADKENRNQLKLTPPTGGEITYTIKCDKFFPMVTNYRTAGGEALLIAVRVQPCNGKKP